MTDVLIIIPSAFLVLFSIFYIYGHSIGLHTKQFFSRMSLFFIGGNLLLAMVAILLNSIKWMKEGDVFGGILFTIIALLCICYAMAMIVGSFFLKRKAINIWLEYVFKLGKV